MEIEVRGNSVDSPTIGKNAKHREVRPKMHVAICTGKLSYQASLARTNDPDLTTRQRQASRSTLSLLPESDSRMQHTHRYTPKLTFESQPLCRHCHCDQRFLILMLVQLICSLGLSSQVPRIASDSYMRPLSS